MIIYGNIQNWAFDERLFVSVNGKEVHCKMEWSGRQFVNYY